MGNLRGHRGRLAPALVLTALAVVAVFAVAAPAFADHPDGLDTWTHNDASSCTSCHASMSGPGPNPANTLCTQCHDYKAHDKAGTPSNCWNACHSPGQDMTALETNAAVGGCGATAAGAGCHNGPGHIGSTPTTCLSCHGTAGNSAHHHASVTDVTVKPVLTVKMSATSIKLKKTFKASGLARPISLTYKVSAQLQKKVGAKWVKVGAAKKVAPNATTWAWSVTFKPTAKGSYRVVVTTPAVPSTTTVGVTAVSKGSKTSKTCVVK